LAEERKQQLKMRVPVNIVESYMLKTKEFEARIASYAQDK
jgi:hypothetical protein